MNGVHDMGGFDCFGPIELDDTHTLFHAPWERQVLSLSLAMGATGMWNLDQSRAARESLPPAQYLGSSYYQIWLAALETLLIQNNLVTREELKSGCALTQETKDVKPLKAEAVPAALKKGSSVARKLPYAARYHLGDRVQVDNLHVKTHTRMPAYIRGKCGVIHAVHGAHVFPDSHALGKGEDPQWLYNVRFSAQELWGSRGEGNNAVHVDCWEPYLLPLSE